MDASEVSRFEGEVDVFVEIEEEVEELWLEFKEEAVCSRNGD